MSRQIKITNKVDAFDFISRLHNYVNKPNFEEITIKVITKKSSRSNKQNRYYWGVIIGTATEFYLKNIRALIIDLMEAMRFEITPDFIHELFKLMFNKGQSTIKLKTDEMMQYQDNIRHHFWHKYKIDIPPPNELPINLTIKNETENEQH